MRSQCSGQDSRILRRSPYLVVWAATQSLFFTPSRFWHWPIDQPESQERFIRCRHTVGAHAQHSFQFLPTHPTVRHPYRRGLSHPYTAQFNAEGLSKPSYLPRLQLIAKCTHAFLPFEFHILISLQAKRRRHKQKALSTGAGIDRVAVGTR